LQVKQRQLSSLRIYFRNLFVHRSFLQYKSQCLEKVNVKYVIKRLWHEIFHMVPGINPRPIAALQLRCRAWYGSLGLIPGPIWKMACNNLLLIYDRLNLWRHRQLKTIFYQFLHIRIEIIHGSHMYILFLPRVGLYASFLPLAFARGKTSWHKGIPMVKTIYTYGFRELFLKQTQITQIRHYISYKQLEIRTNRT
jgi:hypothetical protein